MPWLEHIPVQHLIERSTAAVTVTPGLGPFLSMRRPTRLVPGVDSALRLSPRTVVWLAEHPHARRLIHSVWDTLTTLERSGQYLGAILALRRIVTEHQPTAAGRCRTCRRVAWRRRPFPCAVWHQIRFDLLGLVAGACRQPAGHCSSPELSGNTNPPATTTATVGDR